MKLSHALLRARKIAAAVRNPLWRRALKSGVLVTAEHRRALAPIHVKTVLDIGANRGQFALLCRTIFPHATVQAFEPLPGPAATLRSIFRHDRNVAVHEVAIDTDVGCRAMHVSISDDSSSLLPIGQGQLAHFPKTGEHSVITIEARKIDECIDPRSLRAPVLVKIDVQGNERGTLRACSSILDRVDYIYVELSFEELYLGQDPAGTIISDLVDWGFELRSVENVVRGQGPWAVQADFLFHRVTGP